MPFSHTKTASMSMCLL